MKSAGALLILLSAALFAGATATAKVATGRFLVHPMWVTLARFALGLIILLPAVVRGRVRLAPISPTWVAVRTATNIAAVFLVFTALATTTVSKVNLLNMTYPVFVFAFAPAVTRERTPPVFYVLLLITLVGVWNVVRPSGTTGWAAVVAGDVLALTSAVVAGFAIAALRRARRSDDTRTILFWMMAVGTLVNGAVAPALPVPSASGLPAALLAGLLGALGQLALTIGFRDVSAAAGSLISTVRIPLAGLIGVLLFGDAFTGRTLLGSLLIVASLVVVALLRGRQTPCEQHDAV